MKRLTIYHWLAFSLVIHGLVAVPFVLVGLHKADHVRHKKLSIELFGMVSNRQVEERKKGGGVPRPAAKPAQRVARQTGRPAAPVRSDAYTTVATESPVQVEKGEEKAHEAEGEGGGPFGSSASGGSGMGSGNVQQKGQSIGDGDQVKSVIAAYLAKVSRRVQANLVYPEETRKHGVEGVSTVSFTVTESGAIREGSLRVRKSSGYESLDSNALKSTLASAPFEKPPKELTVIVAVEFNVELASRTNHRASR
jgi:protein TonB